MGNKYFPFVLIDENGKLKYAELKAFVKKVKRAEGEVPFRLISIIGPQSSGKSTLQNHLFGTNFAVMDSNIRGATTHGIWLAKSPDADNCTLVMDLEGSDGNKRGEDDTNFEKQAAVFAFAVSDIVLINVWSNNVGCVNAANIPLLRNVFEAMRKLELHDSKPTLWFVIRDKPKGSSIDVIEKCLREDISRVWDSVAKGTLLSNSFEVEITILSHYEHKRQEFDKKVVTLRQKLLAKLTTNGKKMRPSEFLLSVELHWEKIKKDEDLNLPANRVMAAERICKQIADRILFSFKKKDFRKCRELILSEYLDKYDKKTEYYDEVVKNKQRTELEEEMLASINSQVKTDKENPGVVAGVIGGVAATSLAAIGIAACITLGLGVGIPIAITCGTGVASIIKGTISNTSLFSKVIRG